jgi:hypothetical protein
MGDMYQPEITLALFSVYNILRLGSWLPQIVQRGQGSERVKAYSTWGLWIGASASTAGYATIDARPAAARWSGNSAQQPCLRSPAWPGLKAARDQR